MRYFIYFAMAVVAVFSPSVLMAQSTTADGSDLLVRQLDEFGPIGNSAEVQKTWEAARAALKDRAGVIVVPARVWPMLKTGSLQSLIRIPDPPAETKTWKHGSGLTVLTADRERPVLHVPPLAGLKLERELRMNDGDSVPHWGTHPMLNLESRLVYGSVSYLDWLQAATEKGTDRRFYVPTVRGLVPGQFLNVHGGPGYGGGLQAGGPVSGVTGLSADTTPARNLRGENVPVPAGQKTIDIHFPHPEADNNYAVFIEQTWLTNRAISNKTAEGFSVTFADAAPKDAKLDWMLLR